MNAERGWKSSMQQLFPRLPGLPSQIVSPAHWARTLFSFPYIAIHTHSISLPKDTLCLGLMTVRCGSRIRTAIVLPVSHQWTKKLSINVASSTWQMSFRGSLPEISSASLGFHPGGDFPPLPTRSLEIPGRGKTGARPESPGFQSDQAWITNWIYSRHLD